jgi:hypothetical protein
VNRFPSKFLSRNDYFRATALRFLPRGEAAIILALALMCMCAPGTV